MKIVIGITGASGSIYAFRLLEVLRNEGHELHLVVSDSGLQVIEYECGIKRDQLLNYAHAVYDVHNVAAAIASGSFKAEAMVILPCSMNTCGSIASGVTDTLLTRAADVMLKEGRKLILVPRETPMHTGHLEKLVQLSKLGAIIMPACPGFYHLPKNIDDLVNMLVGKICDRLGVEVNIFSRWQGME